MQDFLKMYRENRSNGHSIYESFGRVADHIAYKGDFEDLQEVARSITHDIQDEAERTFILTEYERKLKESGHKQSDFL